MTAGSQPIAETGRPRGAQPCSPRLVKCSSHLVPCPVSTSRTHPAPASPLTPAPRAARALHFNHARYDVLKNVMGLRSSLAQKDDKDREGRTEPAPKPART